MLPKALLAGACLAGCVGAEQPRSYDGYTFERYIAEFNKSYAASELPFRKVRFLESLEKIRAHNMEYRAGKSRWFMAVNHLADWTDEESAQLRGTKIGRRAAATADFRVGEPNPEAVDWRDKGSVTPVKNQGICGSCWAFATAEVVESHYHISSGTLLVLSPQTYVDCVLNPDDCGGTGGCSGATVELALNLTVRKGVALEKDLPYEGKDDSCPKFTPAVKAESFAKLPTNDAEALETALATKGPMGVTVAADTWALYGGGIYDGCSQAVSSSSPSMTLDHLVEAVGYTKEYWIVRNSWGTAWGEKGYIRLSRANDDKTFIDGEPGDGSACKPYPKQQEVGGECGVLFDISYPVGVSAAGEIETVVV